MLYKQHTIPLFWWSTIKFHHKEHENFGDLVGPYLIKRMTGKEVRFIHPKKRKWHELFTKVFVTAGSILAQIDKNCIVWGSGIIDKNTKVPEKATYLAVRGPITRAILMKQGCAVPKVYGDPALLLPKYYHPKTPKKFELGIIPHVIDYELVYDWYKNDPNIKVINLYTNNVESVIDEVCSCNTIISSSLHGIIVAHAYNLSAVWVKFSNAIFGDDIKYYDYFESVGVLNAEHIPFNQKLTKIECVKLSDDFGYSIKNNIIKILQKGLLTSFKRNFSFNR